MRYRQAGRGSVYRGETRNHAGRGGDVVLRTKGEGTGSDRGTFGVGLRTSPRMCWVLVSHDYPSVVGIVVGETKLVRGRFSAKWFAHGSIKGWQTSGQARTTPGNGQHRENNL